MKRSIVVARQSVLLALIESSWLTLAAGVIAALSAETTAAWPLWFGASAINLFVNLTPESKASRRPLAAARVVAALLALLVLGLWPLRLPTLVPGLYLVWHCRALAEIDLPEERYRASVFAGVGGVVVALLGAAWFRPAMTSAADWPLISLFALSALSGLVIAQRLRLEEDAGLSDAGGKGFGIAVGAAAATVVVAAFIFGLLPWAERLLGVVLRAAGVAANFLASWIIVPLLSLLFAALFAGLSLLLRGVRFPPLRPLTQPAPTLEQLRAQQAQLNRVLDNWLHGLGLLALALVILALLLALRRGIRRSDETSPHHNDLRRSVWRWGLLWEWWRRRLRQAVAGLADLRMALPAPPSRRSPTTVRDVYLDVQRQAARLGERRRPEQTALEHCAALAARLPAVADPLRRLAVGYGEERYDGANDAVLVQALTPDWRRIIEECRANESHGS